MRISFNETRRNKIGSYILILFFIMLTGLLGAVIGFIYNNLFFGVIMAVIIGAIYSLIVFKSGDKMILNMSGAKPVTKAEYPYLYHTVEGLAISAGIPPPKAYVIEDNALNAFATGKDPEHASIAVTTGLLKKLNREELEGVVAHEMSHIKNYDIRFMMLTIVLIGIVTLLSHFILRSFWFTRNRRNSGSSIILIIGFALAILSPIAGYLVKMAISRKREYMADSSAATLTRYPQGLANALRKISNDPVPLMKYSNKATANLFISSPFRKKRVKSSLFSTHPPIEERIKRLEEM